ncbi:MAG: division/cell wall cluster transcriptional repressor MraZ, partial [Oscillospiraceae bacterium]
KMNEKSESEDEDVTEFARTLLSGTCEVEPDKQGRIMIPADLRIQAGITKDVVVAGIMNRAEIWDKERWATRNNTSDNDRFDQLMRKLKL